MTDVRPRSLIPRTRLDELLSELQVRLDTVLATRDRVHALLDAVVAVGRDLDLETVLRRVVETATTLAGARYGAFGLVGEGGTLARFLPTGLTEDEIAAIEHWPHGLGLLGLLIKEPRPLRLPRITGHPESYGFPPGHPPMGAFLGVPVRVRGEVFGNLYLTEKRGGGPFEEEDEAVVVALATAAGVAIENARLYEETRAREAWLHASAEITTSLLSGSAPHDVLTLLARRAREMAAADVAAVLLPTADGKRLRVALADGAAPPDIAAGAASVDIAAGAGPVDIADGVASAKLADGVASVDVANGVASAEFADGVASVDVTDGAGPAEFANRVAPAKFANRVAPADFADGMMPEDVAAAEIAVDGSLSGRAFSGGEPVVVTGLDETEIPAVVSGGMRIGPAIAVPLGAAGAVRGVLSLGRRSGRPPFDPGHARMLGSFAGQAAIALELAEAREDAARLGLLEDRDRIANDLRDVVIQRLFAVAMTLMSAIRLVDDPEAASRLRRAVTELDVTIGHIRSTIFALHSPPDPPIPRPPLQLPTPARPRA
ncbi:hypothetical protein Skr01_55540 [Sphaerisporangium krabiense]|uniref:GAF domain-containing protein n=1 Tax=Sphaerisporangium krabiense TaxID=763782 RepID=A0A7W9DTI4_9ACTN|nr:GAF domain-containing protein [Sphaerisporangium krabiense]MBB5630847.1 GAF domain-containing protein [Sphaerisporangium krabiense]GII65469.1 hypothetical protein Skr01_55540 [Sphaerisporangium krabiense]